MDATADWQWTAAELRELSPAAEVLHFGSIASWTPPGAGRIADLVEDVRAGCRVLISYDPNIRPAVAGARKGAVARMEQSVSRAHVVKASRDDAEWLYPDLPIRGAHSRRLPGPRCYLG
jgi:fructokinase